MNPSASVTVLWDSRIDPRCLETPHREQWTHPLKGERMEAHIIGPGIDAAVFAEMDIARLRRHGTSGFRGVLIKDGWKYLTAATLTKGEALHELFVLIEGSQ